jgi:hypothetical protein
VTPSEITSAPLEPIPLRAERSRRLMVALLVVAAVIVIAFAVVAFAGPLFGPDPMTGT